MSNYNINLLIHILKQAEQTHINLEELNDKYQAVERSNFVCNTITKIVDFESPLNFRDTSHYGRELVSTNSIYNYILSYVPKINFDIETQRKIKEITSRGIAERDAEIWAVKYWKEFVHEKNEMLKAIQSGKEIKDFPAYLVGVFKKKGYV